MTIQNERGFLTNLISLKWIVSASVLMLSIGLPVSAADLSRFTTGELVTALRTTLSKSADVAVASLGKTDGFLGNPEVRIPLPKFLDENKSLLRMIGMGSEITNLEQSMNRAAEAAIPKAKGLLKKTIANLTVEDAKKLLNGGNTAVTDFLENKTAIDLQTALKPLVKAETEKFSLANQYNELASKAARFGLVDESEASLETYVTQQALDGLFLMIGKQEMAIRADPVGTGSRLLKKIYGINSP